MSGRTSHVELRRGAYADSVTLLQVSRAVQGVARGRGRAGGDGHRAQPRGAHRDGLRGAARGDDQRPGRRGPAGRRRLARGGAGRRGPGAAPTPRGAPAAGPSEEAPPRTTGAALRRDRRGAVALVSVPGASASSRRWTRVEAGSRRDGVQRQRAGRAGGRAQAGGRRAGAAGDGAGLRHGGAGRASGSGFANVVAPGPVGLVAASGHRLPAGAGAARPRGRRRHPRARRRRPRPVRRGGRAGHARGAAPARRRPGRRAHPAGLEAAGARRWRQR